MKNYILILLIPFFFSCSSDSENNDKTIDLGTSDLSSDLSTELDMGADLAEPETDLGADLSPDMNEELAIFEPGPHQVGYRSWTFEYESKLETREIRLSVWYPTSDTEGTASRYYNLLSRPTIFNDATIIDDQFPLVIFSHGNTSFGEQSYFYTEFLTSHGFVVVAPDHTGNTFRDKSSTASEATVFRPQDISATLDHLEALPAEDPLFGKLTDEIAVSGHSFGGYTSLAVAGASFDIAGFEAGCSAGLVDDEICDFFQGDGAPLFEAGFLDSRIKAAIPMTPAGALLFNTGIADIAIPTLIITAGLDQTLPNRVEGDPLWERSSTPTTRIDILKAGHFTFSNICELAGQTEAVRNDGCGTNFIPYEEAFVIINAYSLAFLKKNLFGDSSYDDFLSGPGAFAEDISLTVK